MASIVWLTDVNWHVNQSKALVYGTRPVVYANVYVRSYPSGMIKKFSEGLKNAEHP